MLRDYEDWKAGGSIESSASPAAMDDLGGGASELIHHERHDEHRATSAGNSEAHREAWASPEPTDDNDPDDDIAAFFRAREAMKRAS